MHHLLHNPQANIKCSMCNEMQFRTLAEQMPDIVLRMDAQNRFLYVNSRIRDLTGIAAEEFFGKTCDEMGLPPHCAVLWEEVVEDTLAKGQLVDREVQLELAGSLKNLHIRTSRDTAFGHGGSAIIATVRDITAMRQSEYQVQELAQRLSYHMNNTPLAVMEWDPSGKCLTWNGEAEQMFGWTRLEMRKKSQSCLELIHPDDRKGFLLLLNRLQQGWIVSDFVKFRALTRNGSLLYCECHLSALLDFDGKAKSILWVANNVTARELAEQDMQMLNAGLEQRIQDRTAELESSNQKLQREILARMLLEREIINISEREHRRVGQDLHDGVCQELSGVRFSLEAISKKRRKGTMLRNQLDNLSGAIERAVQHVRLLSRGLAPLDLEDGNLPMALEELAANTSSLFQINCTVKCAGKSRLLEIEKAMNLFRIAQEAIQNAIKHGKASEICINLNLKQGVLSITDNGNGIPEHATPPSRGNGMGMKIMRHRADVLEGSIAIERSSSGGVCVTCNFPQ